LPGTTSTRSPARVPGPGLEVGVDAVERAVELFLLEELVGFLQAIALRNGRRYRQEAGEQRCSGRDQAHGGEGHMLYFSENIISLAAKSSKFYQEHRVFQTPHFSSAAGTIPPASTGDH